MPLIFPLELYPPKVHSNKIGLLIVLLETPERSVIYIPILLSDPRQIKHGSMVK